MNKVILYGNLTRDFGGKVSKSGMVIAKNSMAINEGKDKTTFIDIVAFDKTAEMLNKYFRKGNPILLEGKISCNNYETKEGEKRKSFEVIVNQFYFTRGVERKKESSAEFFDAVEDAENNAPFDSSINTFGN